MFRLSPAYFSSRVVPAALKSSCAWLALVTMTNKTSCSINKLLLNQHRRQYSFAGVTGFFLSSLWLFTSASSVVAFCATTSITVRQFAEKADKHHAADQVAESYRVAQQATSTFPDDIELLWRLGRAQYLMSKEQTGDDKKKEKEQFVRAAVDTLNKALKMDGESWAANKWMGMALGALGDFVPLKEKIGNSFKIKEHFQKAVAGNPRDATSFHCMGAWCWNILQISSVERSVASWVFATPPSSSFEECEDNLLRSHEIDQTQVHNSLLLGDVYAWKARKEDASKWYYHAARECPANTAYQREYIAQAEKKLVGLLGAKWEETYKK